MATSGDRDLAVDIRTSRKPIAIRDSERFRV